MLFGVEGTDFSGSIPSWINVGTSGIVLTWLLLRGLPDKDKQMSNLVKDKDVLLEKMQDRHTADLRTIMTSQAEMAKEARVAYKEALSMVIDHCQRENAANNVVLDRVSKEIQLAVQDFREVLEELRTKLL